MKTSIFFLFLMVLILSASPSVFANSAPVVSNVSASQRNDDSKLVDIYYNLADADGDHCTIWVVISDNGGSTWTVPAMTFTGAVGANITPGAGKHIVWDAGHDVPGKSGSTFKARVFASDGKGEQMVVVPAGSYPVDGGATQQFVSAYQIGKYEVTNTQYCEFLNNADPTGDHYDTNMEITRSGSSGSYSYAVFLGRENYPIRYVSYYDAEAYTQWKSQTTGLNYHLPDKYQWQKAAAWDPVQQIFWMYGVQSLECASCNFGCGVFPYYCPYGGPLPVGSFNGTGGKNDAKSYYGCYDMSGNVYEWTTEDLGGGYRGSRGGYWASSEYSCRTKEPSGSELLTRNSYQGFRVVLEMN